MPEELKYKIRFLVGFRDGTLFPDYVPQNAECDVTARELQMIQQSGAKVEVLGNIIPKHVPAEPEKISKKVTKE